MTTDPWSNIEEYFKLDQMVKGTVTKVTSFGAFVTLEHDIDGLIHVSQISDDRVDKIKDVLEVGSEIDARVIKVDTNERRVGLSLKPGRAASQQVNRAPDLKPGTDLGSMEDFFGKSHDA